MDNYALDSHGIMLLREYREKLPLFTKLQDVVMQQLNELIASNGIELNSMESRIKGEKSLAGKLERKGHKYKDITDITDIFGARIIAFYNEDVDRIAAVAETLKGFFNKKSADVRRLSMCARYGECRVIQIAQHNL